MVMQPVVEPTKEVEDRETKPSQAITDGDSRPTGYESAPESGPQESQTQDPTGSHDDELPSGQTGAEYCGSHLSASSSNGSGDEFGSESGSALSLEEDEAISQVNAAA